MKRLVRTAAVCVLAAASSLAVSGCTACSAVGYLYSGPAVVQLETPLPTDHSMAACFGDACEPATLARGDGERWDVPQETPFVGATSRRDGSERRLRVVVTDPTGATVSDGTYEIPVTAESTGVFGQCPGPFVFEPVVIGLAG